MSEVFHNRAQDEGPSRDIYSSKTVNDSKGGRNKFQLVDNGNFSFGRKWGEDEFRPGPLNRFYSAVETIATKSGTVRLRISRS